MWTPWGGWGAVTQNIRHQIQKNRENISCGATQASAAKTKSQQCFTVGEFEGKSDKCTNSGLFSHDKQNGRKLIVTRDSELTI